MLTQHNVALKTILLFISIILMFTLISCEKTDNTPEQSNDSSEVTSADSQSEDKSSVSEETSIESTQVVSEDSTSEIVASITDIDDFEKLGLTKENNLYLLINAFLNGDTATLEEMGDFEEGIFDAYKSLEIGDYSLRLNEDEIILFDFDIIKSELETMPVGQYTLYAYDGMAVCYFYDHDDDSEWTTVHKALYQWHVLSGSSEHELDFSNPSTLVGSERDAYIYKLTEYILWYHKDITLEQFQQYAYLYSGIADVQPDSSFDNGNGTYSVPGHGVSSWSHDSIEEKEENGITTVTIQFYADWAKTIKSHVIEYKLKNIDGDWVFLSSDCTYKAQFEAASFSN